MSFSLPSRCLIGLTGAAGAGKDTCAQLMAHWGFFPVAFADALRAEVAAAWSVPVSLLLDRSTKEMALASLSVGMCRDIGFLNWARAQALDLYAPRSPRWVAQTWGTDYRRAADPDYWLRPVERRIRYQRGAYRGRLVVTDVRFVNEAYLLTAMDGHVVQVARPELHAMPRETASHISETQRVGISTAAEIHNDGDLHHLDAECVRVLQQLFPQESHA